MKITSQMIADRCGVSRGTVDRVVNGRANVAPEVRARVQRIIDELGYRTPAQRRQARPAQQGATIGFIIPAWGEYYIRQTRRGIQSALRRIGDAGSGWRRGKCAAGPTRSTARALLRSRRRRWMGWCSTRPIPRPWSRRSTAWPRPACGRDL